MNAIATDKTKDRKRGQTPAIRCRKGVSPPYLSVRPCAVAVNCRDHRRPVDIPAARLLLSWGTTALAYVAMAARNFVHFDIDQVQLRASEQYEGGDRDPVVDDHCCKRKR